ncbi:serine hydrolase [Bacillus sp. FJAT-27264]|uniref:serine hydrolase domain-containing protein n=1 Tax=Paenibacillus sp. (strain DSM 101736 / FJAT-27264) TaxID=1850362 RepID=UPI000807DF50|nr:serine hydrolase domain-containing protein [Bacillus sp. FJAT-27264]OBZ10704.1 serine hydrolase [Bacillus sp. FJAT-27264]
MRGKRFVILSTTLALTLLTPLSVMADSSSNKPNYASTQKLAAEKAALLTDTYGTTSLQYALIDQGNIVISGHSGKNQLAKNIPLTADTIYGIGSTSKMFTAAAVMKLVDEGKLDLDQPLTGYIPDFTMKEARYGQITPRMLLNHSAGIEGSSFNRALLFNDNDTYAHDHLLEQLATQSLKADPGAFSVYSNDGYTLAEILVERVSGLDFTTFIHKNFTEPLGMKNTKTPIDPIDKVKMAGTFIDSSQTPLPLENYNVIGTGGIRSTAEDLVKFSQIFTGQVEGILSVQSVKAMAEAEYKKGMWPKNTDATFGYGLGWDSVDLFPFNTYGIQALTKGGDTTLFHSSLVVLPEYNLAAAVTSSGGSSTTDQLLANEILLSALQAKGVIKERKAEKSHGLPVKAKMPQEMSDYAGIYGASNSLMKIAINPSGEMVLTSLLYPGDPGQKYVYTADGSFKSEDGTEKFKFVVEKNGRTYLWSSAYVSVPGLGQTVFSEYTAEKLEANPLSKDVAAAWNKREGKMYYMMNEKYSSISYFSGLPAFPIVTSKEAPGYIVNNKIVDANKAISQLQIPTIAGRDSMEFNFFTKDGIEYVKTTGGYLYAGAEVLKPLYAGKQSTATIQADGLARWFTVPATAKGKILSVKLPKNSAVIVYDEAGMCVNDTAVSGKNEVVLPENGTIVFAGDAGAKFEIALKSGK